MYCACFRYHFTGLHQNQKAENSASCSSWFPILCFSECKRIKMFVRKEMKTLLLASAPMTTPQDSHWVLLKSWVTISAELLYTEHFFSASANCTLVKWQNVNHLGKWAPAAIVREWRCQRKGKRLNEVSCQKSTVQRVIWENMTTLQRQGVIMASQ